MIARLLTDLGGRAAGGDAVATVDDTISVIRDPDGGWDIRAAESAETQIRVLDQGRIGWAGGESRYAEEILAAAWRSAAVGETARFFLPAPSPLPEVVTRSPSTGAMGPRELRDLIAMIAGRLDRKGVRLEVAAERSVGAVEVGNTRGVSAEYQTSSVAVQARLWVDGGPAEPLGSHLAQVGPIEPRQIEGMVAELDRFARIPTLELEAFPRTVPVWFGPRAVRALLAPLLTRLAGEEWLAGKDQWPELDARFTLSDDPLAPGRPGSRPIDDDGVPTRRITLIDAGRAVQGILDIESASTRWLPSTGHAWRRGFARPRVGFANLVVDNGTAAEGDRLAAAENGLLVRSLRFGPAPNPITGAFRVGVPWAYRIEAGAVTGRVDGVVLAGNVFELLNRVLVVGDDREWIGSAAVPSLVLDGVGARIR